MSHPIGIDLGTTYSTISKWVKRTGYTGSETYNLNKEARKLLASKVFFSKDDEIIVGNHAILSGFIQPDNLVELPKRDLDIEDVSYIKQNKTYTPEEVLSFILKELLHEVISIEGKNFIPSGIVLTTPYYFKNLQNSRTKKAIIEAIEDVFAVKGEDYLLDIIPEPVAALLDYVYTHELDAKGSRHILLFDLGGGTLDVTVVKLDYQKDHKICIEILGVDGNERLGGEDFDLLMLDWVCKETGLGMNSSQLDKYDKQKLSVEIKNIKEILSSQKSYDLYYTSQRTGSISIKITRKDLENILTGTIFSKGSVNYISKIEQVIDSVVHKAHIQREDVATIILNGGSSKILLVKELLTEMFTNSKVVYSPKIDTSVSRGAALYAAYLLNKKQGSTNTLWKNITIKEKTRHQLGIEVNNKFFKLIGENLDTPVNYSLPLKKTVEDRNEESVLWNSITILQGNKKDFSKIGTLPSEQVYVHGRNVIQAGLTMEATGKNVAISLTISKGNKDGSDLIIKNDFMI